MSTVEKISIALSGEMLRRVREAVGTGDYSSTSEVIREALREWKAGRSAGASSIAERALQPSVEQMSPANALHLHPLTREHQREVELLCKRYAVRHLAFFGSVLRADFDVASSDVDVAVIFGHAANLASDRQYFDLKDGLEQVLGRPVDLVELDAMPDSRLRRIIERTQVPVYVASQAA